MPQSFHVLRCCRCDVFQVQQVKKVKKWACKMCGEKQSVLRVYGEGTGLECRKHVQKLNMMQGEKEALIGQYQQQEEFTVDIPQPAGNNEFQSAPQGTKWAQFVESEEEEEEAGEGDENTQIPCTTDHNAFEQANRESRKMRRKAFQGRYETPTPYERPSTMKTPHPEFTSNSIPLKAFSSKSSACDSVTSSSSGASTGYNALTKNKFQMHSKSIRPQQKSTDSDVELDRQTTWNRGKALNVGSDGAEEGKRGNFNITHSTQLSASGEASTIGSQSKWSKFSNLQTENDRLQNHNAPKFQPSPEHNVPTSDAKSKWNRFGIIENCEESDARSLREPSNDLAGSRNSATLFKPSKPWQIHNSNPTIPKETIREHNVLGYSGSSHNVPSFSGSNHNVPQTKTFNAAGLKSTDLGKSKAETKPDNGSKWGRFLIDEANENEEEEEEEEEEEDVNDEGQIMVELDGIRTDEVKQSEQRNVFYTEQNFELELEDW